MMNVLEIKTIKDIRDKVPSEKYDEFCDDLKVWLNMRAGIAVLNDAVVEFGGDPVIEDMYEHTVRWVDDGVKGISKLTIHMENE